MARTSLSAISLAAAFRRRTSGRAPAGRPARARADAEDPDRGRPPGGAAAQGARCSGVRRADLIRHLGAAGTERLLRAFGRVLGGLVLELRIELAAQEHDRG